MIYIMLTAMRLLVIQHDLVSPPGPISERFADHGYDVVPHLVVDAQNFHSPNIFPDPTSASLSATLGFGAQPPLHTDGAHHRIPPDFCCASPATAKLSANIAAPVLVSERRKANPSAPLA